MTSEKKTYRCPVCHYLVRIRLDGTIGEHHKNNVRCTTSGQPMGDYPSEDAPQIRHRHCWYCGKSVEVHPEGWFYDHERGDETCPGSGIVPTPEQKKIVGPATLITSPSRIALPIRSTHKVDVKLKVGGRDGDDAAETIRDLYGVDVSPIKDDGRLSITVTAADVPTLDRAVNWLDERGILVG